MCLIFPCQIQLSAGSISHLETRVPQKPLATGVGSYATNITSHEQTQ